MRPITQALQALHAPLSREGESTALESMCGYMLQTTKENAGLNEHRVWKKNIQCK
jgi:hypothetical protein